MNQRIRELAECNERIQNFFQTGPAQQAAIEQFAKLIVQECADLFDQNETDIRIPEYRIHESIKHHFGIEE